MSRSRNRAGLSAAIAAAGLMALTGCSDNVATSSNDLVNGKRQFVAKCGSCHQLDRAGTKGSVGPNLDAAFRRPLADGFGRTTVRGVVAEMIQYPPIGEEMPANLVHGDDVTDVAAYVATVVSKGGKDTGLLASAIKPAGSGKPAVAKDGALAIDADPTGQLAFLATKASAAPGQVKITMKNASDVPHNIALDGGGKGAVVGKGGTSQISADLKPGSYTYFCSVQGHREGGMVGKLTVK